MAADDDYKNAFAACFEALDEGGRSGQRISMTEVSAEDDVLGSFSVLAVAEVPPSKSQCYFMRIVRSDEVDGADGPSSVYVSGIEALRLVREAADRLIASAEAFAREQKKGLS